MIRPNVLPLEHVPNARDLGGYVGFDGRKIKMHRLLRTGKLCQMTLKRCVISIILLLVKNTRKKHLEIY